MTDILTRAELEQKWVGPGPGASDEAFKQWDDIQALHNTALVLAEKGRLAAYGAGDTENECGGCPCAKDCFSQCLDAAQWILDWWEGKEATCPGT